MKNEIELNIHLFFPEQRNEEISAEQHKALETLLALPELDQEDSVEKFTSELTSRFELIKPILGDQTEEFLGYSQDDITKLSNFFNGKFERFGMDAVAVQKILRNIWLQTPRQDKRLNYDLYKFIDKKFYSIVNERKRKISFDHIPRPQDNNSLEVLGQDWLACRAHYAECLDIDLDYLNNEAIDGTIFPSISGLFANPSPSHLDIIIDSAPDHSELTREEDANNTIKMLEHLNFWMPYCLGDKKLNKSSFDSLKKILNVSVGYFIYFKRWNHPSADVFRGISWSSKKKGMQVFMCNPLPIHCSNRQISSENYMKLLYTDEDMWFDTNKEHWGILPPTEFSNLWIKRSVTGDLQLPDFINSCNEYAVVNGDVKKSSFLRFHKGKKIYFPHYAKPYFVMAADAFEAAKIDMPSDNDTLALETYFKNIYPLMRSEAEGIIYQGVIPQTKMPLAESVFNFRRKEFITCVKNLFYSHVNNNALPDAYKVRVLTSIKSCFQNLGCYYMDDEIKKFDLKAEFTTLSDEINFLYKLNEIERENEKLKLQKKEADTRVSERDSIITTICHNINGTIGSIKVNLDSNVKRVPNDIRSSLERALSGAKMIGNMVDQILRSYKYTKEQFFDDIDNPDDSSYRFGDMLYENLDIVVENTFSDDFLYEQKYLFSDETEMQRLQEEFYNSPQDDILDFINKNFTNIKITIPENILNKRIGNKNGTATNIYILFNEFIKNAFRALAYVPSDKRAFSIEAYDNEEQIIFEIKNTCLPESETHTHSKGFGGLITSNIIKAFGELKKTISSDGQQFSLKVIIQKRQGEV